MKGMAATVDIIDSELNPNRLSTSPRNKLMLVPSVSLHCDQGQILRFPRSVVDESVRDASQVVQDFNGSVDHKGFPGIWEWAGE